MTGSKERIMQYPEVMKFMFNWLHLTNTCAVPTNTFSQISYVNHISTFTFSLVYNYKFYFLPKFKFDS